MRAQDAEWWAVVQEKIIREREIEKFILIVPGGSTGYASRGYKVRSKQSAVRERGKIWDTLMF